MSPHGGFLPACRDNWNQWNQVPTSLKVPDWIFLVWAFGIALRDLTVMSELQSMALSLTSTRVWPSYMLRINGRRTHFTQIELNKSKKVCFTPWYSTRMVYYGGMGIDCEAFNRRWAQLVSDKRKVSFGSVMTHIRTRSRFALLRSVVTALRWVRGRRSGSGMKDLSNVNFDFVPEGEL